VKRDLLRLGKAIHGETNLTGAQYIEIFDRVKQDPVVRCLDGLMYETKGVIEDDTDGNAQLIMLKKQEIAGVKQDIEQTQNLISMLEKRWWKKGKPKKLKPKDQALFDRLNELKQMKEQYDDELEVLNLGGKMAFDDWMGIAMRARSRIIEGVMVNAEAMSSSATFGVVALRSLREGHDIGAFDPDVDISAEYTTLLQALLEKDKMSTVALSRNLRRELRYAEVNIATGEATDIEEIYADTILQFLKNSF